MSSRNQTSVAFAVAVCTRNRAGFLRNCLESLLASLGSIPASVLVVDNGSTDDTATVVAGFGQRVAYALEPKIGLSHARNRALAACDTTYLVFLDDDGVPDPCWAPAVAATVAAGEADVFGGPFTPFYTDPKPAWFDDWFASAHSDLEDGRQIPPVCFSGGNMGWRAELLRQVGGFDSNLGVYGRNLRLGEETALQTKLHRSQPELDVRFVRAMSMKHHVAREKMRLSYILRRNYMYGWQLRDIDPFHPFHDISGVGFLARTRLGLPLVLRALHRDRKRDRYWRTYAAHFLTLNGILLGVQVRRILGPRGLDQR